MNEDNSFKPFGHLSKKMEAKHKIVVTFKIKNIRL